MPSGPTVRPKRPNTSTTMTAVAISHHSKAMPKPYSRTYPLSRDKRDAHHTTDRQGTLGYRTVVRLSAESAPRMGADRGAAVRPPQAGRWATPDSQAMPPADARAQCERPRVSVGSRPRRRIRKEDISDVRTGATGAACRGVGGSEHHFERAAAGAAECGLALRHCDHLEPRGP